MTTEGFIFLQRSAKVNASLRRTAALLAIAETLSGCGSQNAAVPDKQVAAAEKTQTVDAGPARPSLAPTPAATEAADFALSCTNPVRLGSAVSDVRAEFGQDATIETRQGAEGFEYKALVLWARDPARRLELPYDEELKAPVVGSVEIGSPRSRWRARTLAPGDPLVKVATANGKPFMIAGFGWDYGGNVTDWKGGKLAAAERCGISLQFRPGKDAADGYAQGDSNFSSNDPRILKARAVVDRLTVVRGE